MRSFAAAPSEIFWYYYNFINIKYFDLLIVVFDAKNMMCAADPRHRRLLHLK